jgi:SseB protein N-terminal domain
MTEADTTTWTPANDLEAGLYRALRAQDSMGFLDLLANAELLVPVPTAVGEGREPMSWVATMMDDLPCLPVFTSNAALMLGTNHRARYHWNISFRDLVADWPDMRYVMALDPLTPLFSRIAASDLLRMAAQPIVDILRHPGDERTTAAGTVVQKFLTASQASRMLRTNEDVVSGYVVPMHEVQRLDPPEQIFGELPIRQLNPEIVAQPGEIYLVRWLAVGAQLYRPACGGADAEQLAAAQGWVVEEPPFRGTGFVIGTHPAVQLYLVNAVHLTHGAELLVLNADGQETVVASYDADLESWAFAATFLAALKSEEEAQR